MSDEIGAGFDDTRKARYLAWLLTPKSQREPATQAGIAELCGVSPRTLRDWNKNEEFRAAWKAEAALLVATPDDIQEVLDALKAKALDPTARDQVSAAKEWLNRVTPAVESTGAGEKPVSKLTDEELDALITARAQETQEQRAQLRLVEGG